MNLELETEAAKQIYIDAGNINWSTLSLPEMDQAMFDILILMTTSASPSRSVLIESPYRNIPKKKLQSYLESDKEETNTQQIKTPLINYVNFLLGHPVSDSLEVNVLKLDLEASTSITADTVDMLCSQLKNTNLGEEKDVPTVAIIQELTNKYNTEELQKITANEFFFESTSRKILEKISLEEEEKLQMKTKKRRAQKEMATEQWTRDFIKSEFRLSFLTILKFNLGEKLTRRGEVLLECLGISGEESAERIVVHEEVDRLLFYLSALFLLTNMCSFPIIGAPPTLQQVMTILRGENIKNNKLPGLYNVPPLRLCKEGSLKRKSHSEEPMPNMPNKRAYHNQHPGQSYSEEHMPNKRTCHNQHPGQFSQPVSY